jgi:hypothetical protein
MPRKRDTNIIALMCLTTGGIIGLLVILSVTTKVDEDSNSYKAIPSITPTSNPAVTPTPTAPITPIPKNSPTPDNNKQVPVVTPGQKQIYGGVPAITPRQKIDAPSSKSPIIPEEDIRAYVLTRPPEGAQEKTLKIELLNGKEVNQRFEQGMSYYFEDRFLYVVTFEGKFILEHFGRPTTYVRVTKIYDAVTGNHYSEIFYEK